MLGTLKVTDHSLPELLDRVVRIAADAVQPAALVAMTLDVDARRTMSTAACNDDDAAEIDASQYVIGGGPCLEAAHENAVQVVASTPSDRRWRTFSETCIAYGILSAMAVPVVGAADRRGALNFYSRSEDSVGAGEIEAASAFALQAAVFVHNAESYWSARELADQLATALESRIVIEQAKGVLMSSGQSAGAAFKMLVSASQRESRKLREVAADVVARAESRADH